MKLIVPAIALLVLVVLVAIALRTDESGDSAAGDLLPAETPTTTAVQPQAVPESLPTPATTTTLPPRSTTAAPSTTATAPPETTTSAAPTTTQSSGYTSIPKPSAGPNTVAPAGALTKHLAADIATAFGFTSAEVEAAIAEVELPPEANGNPEGWLAPGTYEPADSANTQVQAMVDRRVRQLEDRNISRDQWYRVLTAASVIEKETYNQNEKPNVARVLANRLAGGGPLQMDSIILYPVPEDRIFTTSEERASNQPYNSYRHNGLPPTPICSPDEASLDAFLEPPPGDWWFYVTVNLHSGETRYAISYEEHKVNVELLRAWLEDHPTP